MKMQLTESEVKKLVKESIVRILTEKIDFDKFSKDLSFSGKSLLDRAKQNPDKRRELNISLGNYTVIDEYVTDRIDYSNKFKNLGVSAIEAVNENLDEWEDIFGKLVKDNYMSDLNDKEFSETFGTLSSYYKRDKYDTLERNEIKISFGKKIYFIGDLNKDEKEALSISNLSSTLYNISDILRAYDKNIVEGHFSLETDIPSDYYGRRNLKRKNIKANDTNTRIVFSGWKKTPELIKLESYIDKDVGLFGGAGPLEMDKMEEYIDMILNSITKSKITVHLSRLDYLLWIEINPIIDDNVTNVERKIAHEIMQREDYGNRQQKVADALKKQRDWESGDWSRFPGGPYD